MEVTVSDPSGHFVITVTAGLNESSSAAYERAWSILKQKIKDTYGGSRACSCVIENMS